MALQDQGKEVGLAKRTLDDIWLERVCNAGKVQITFIV